MGFRSFGYQSAACPNWYSCHPNLSAADRVIKAHSGLDDNQTGEGEEERGTEADPAMLLVCTGGYMVEAFSAAWNTGRGSGLRGALYVHFWTC